MNKSVSPFFLRRTILGHLSEKRISGFRGGKHASGRVRYGFGERSRLAQSWRVLRPSGAIDRPDTKTRTRGLTTAGVRCDIGRVAGFVPAARRFPGLAEFTQANLMPKVYLIEPYRFNPIPRYRIPMLNKPLRTGRGKGNKDRPSRQSQHEDRVEGYPSGHILSKQNTCLADRRGSVHVAIVESAARFNDLAEIEETYETHLIPRRSITRKEHIKLFPIFPDADRKVDLKFRQAERDDKGNLVGKSKHNLGKWDAKLGCSMISGSNVRQVGGGRKITTLLTTSNTTKTLDKITGDDVSGLNLKRQRSKSKRIGFDADANFVRQSTPKLQGERVYSADDPVINPKD